MSHAQPSARSPVEVFLGLGSNLGDSHQQLADALQFLSDSLARHTALCYQRTSDQSTAGITAVSSLYQSDAVGGPADSPDFLNLVVQLQTEMTPHELLSTCQQAEQLAERVRKERWGPRTLDVDVLLYGDLHRAEPDLTIPHQRMFERKFVIDPLAELAPELVQTLLAKFDPQKREALKNERAKQDCCKIAPAPWQPASVVALETAGSDQHQAAGSA